MQLPTQRHLATVEEYLKYEKTAMHKHEYRNGEVIAMAGNTYFHSLIAMNCGGELREKLKGKPCKVLDSNLRIGIPSSARYSYPDLSVVCGAPEIDLKDPDKLTVTNPRVIIEILSPSTEAKDRGEKFADYQKLTSLEEYVLISQDRARVEVFRRQSDGTWVLTYFSGLDALLKLASLQADVALSEIYDGVELPLPHDAE